MLGAMKQSRVVANSFHQCLVVCGVGRGQFSTGSGDLFGVKNVEKDIHAGKDNKVSNVAREYQKLCVWRDISQVVDTLYNNVVYHDKERDKSGLVVINKPYGLPLRPSEDSAYSLDMCLPGLASRLEVETLEVVKCAERFSSGVTLLGTPATAVAYKRCLGNNSTNRSLATSYLALVKGQPSINRLETVDRRMVDCPEVTKPLFNSMHKEPVLSRNLVRQGKLRFDKAKRIHVAISSLARSSLGCGVVELSPSSTGKHFIQVYLADVGFPLLGDQMYDYRARTMMGQKVKLSTAHTNANRTQMLPAPVMEALGLARGEEWLIPRMLHQHRIFLPDWLGSGKSLTVFAPPPDHWVNTCKVVGLHLDFKEVMLGDKVKHWEAKEKKVDKDNQKVQIVQTDLGSHISDLD